MLLNTATVGIFYASIYICKPSEICGRKSSIILTSSFLKWYGKFKMCFISTK